MYILALRSQCNLQLDKTRGLLLVLSSTHKANLYRETTTNAFSKPICSTVAPGGPEIHLQSATCAVFKKVVAFGHS